MNKWRGKYSKKPAADEPEKQGPYGFVVVLRGLQKAAIRLRDRPGALVVLNVVAGYMDQEGKCRVSQDTIAAQLDLTRQAVNLHLKFLKQREVLFSDASRDGVLKTYYLDQCGVTDVRFGQERIDERRKAKRAAKAGKFDPAVAPKATSAPPIAQLEQAPVRDSRLEVGKLVHHAEHGRGIVIWIIHGGKVTVRWDYVMALPLLERARVEMPQVAPSSLRVLDEPPDAEAYRSAMGYAAMRREDPGSFE